jgi:hypothetical protein
MRSSGVKSVAVMGFAACALLAGGSPSFGASFTSATVDANADGIDSQATVNSLPYATPADADADGASSLTTPDFSGLVYKTSFSQTLQTSDDEADGQTAVNFTAGTGDTYSLFGSTVNTGGTSTFSLSLEDDTTEVFAYDQDPESGTIGTTTGSLNDGDAYTFTLFDAISANGITTSDVVADTIGPFATNTGSGGITLVDGVVPEPTMTGVVCIAAGALITLRRRRKGRALPVSAHTA